MELVEKLLDARVIENPMSWEDTQDTIRSAWKLGKVVFSDGQKFYLLQGEYHLEVVKYVDLLINGRYIDRIDLRRFWYALEDYLEIGFSLDEIKDFLEVLVDRPLVWAAGGLLTAEAVYSDITEQYYWSEDPDLVWIRCRQYDDQPLLEAEAADYAFWCAATHEWYYRQDFECVEVEGETFLLDAVEDEIHYWQSDNSYHWEPESNLGLRGYHEGFRCLPRSGKCLSFELEIRVGLCLPDFGDNVRQIWDEAEEDSSLGKFGAELIVGFVPIGEVYKKFEEIASLMDRYDCYIPNEDYGFHISASIEGWGLTEAQVDKLARAFYNNYDLVTTVARRDPTRYCRWQNPDRINLERSKYHALRRDDDRLEFRIFKASTDADELMACANLTHAFLEFALSSCENFTEFWQAWNAAQNAA